MRLNGLKASFLAGVAVFGTAYAAPVLAQASDEASSGGDIIVTARRAEEKLQDVPISITVFNQEQLSKSNVAVATDLATVTPSLSVNQRYGPEKASFAIRGFNQDAASAPTVGVYFAEVVGVRAQGGTTSGNTVGAGAFTDLQNVQVLKGPQGTLFGRNTTGGAVLLVPKKPTDKLEGYVEASAGNYNAWKGTAAINVPISDTFKVRAVVERNKRDGYMKNVSGVPGTTDAFNDVNYTYGRLSVVANLTPNLENYTIFHYSNSDTHGFASRMVGCATPTSSYNPLNTVAGTAGYSGTRHLQATSCAIQVARQNARGDSLYDVESGFPGAYLRVKQWQVINTTTWKASDSLTIKNIFSYGEFREATNFDLGTSNFAVAAVDPSPFPGDTRMGFLATRISPRLTTTGGLPGGLPLFIPAGTNYDRIVLDVAEPGGHNSAQRTVTDELQFQGNVGDKFKYTVGGYLEFSRPLGFSGGRTDIFLDCTNPSLLQCSNPLYFGSIAESATQISFNNHGVYAQGTYKFNDQLSLTGGFRYTFDNTYGFTIGTRATLDPANRNPTSFIDPASGVRIYRNCSDIFHNPTAVPGLDRSSCRYDTSAKSSKPTWVIDLDYKFTPDMMAYAKYSRGYRQGGVNFTNPGLETWEPEQLDAYEVGFKGSFRGQVRGYFNLAAFYNKLKNQQFFAGLVPSAEAAARGVAGGNAIVNAGSSRVYGIEVDAGATLFDQLNLGLSYAYLDSKVTDVAAAALACDGTALGQRICGTNFGQAIPSVSVGSPFTYTPKHKISLSATWNVPLDKRVGDVSIGATLVHQSSSLNDGASPAYVDGYAIGVTPAYSVLNMNVDWKSIGGSAVDASFFVTNLTKTVYNVANTSAWNSAGAAEILLGQPRMWGFRLKYHFGD